MISERLHTPPTVQGEPRSYDGEIPAAYVPAEDGDFAVFLSSDKAETVKRQYRRGLAELAAFLDERNAVGEMIQPESFKNFSADLDRNDRPGASPAPRSAIVLGTGKRAFDTIRSAVDDERIPLHARRSLIGRLRSDLTVCASGIASNLNDVAEKIHASSVGLEQTVRRLHAEHIEQGILEYATLAHGRTQHFAGNEIHYVNGYRNALASTFGLNIREDASLPRIVNPPNEQRRDTCRSFVQHRYNGSKLIATLALQARQSLAAHFPASGMLSAAELSERLAAMEAALAPFGDASPHTFIEEFDDASTGETFYRLRNDRGRWYPRNGSYASSRRTCETVQKPHDRR